MGLREYIKEKNAEMTEGHRKGLWEIFSFLAYAGFMVDDLRPKIWVFSVIIHTFMGLLVCFHCVAIMNTAVVQLNSSLLEAIISVNFGSLTLISGLTIIIFPLKRINCLEFIISIHRGVYDYGPTMNAPIIKERSEAGKRKMKYTIAPILFLTALCGVLFVSAKTIDRLTGDSDDVDVIDGVYQHLPVKLWLPFNVTSNWTYVFLMVYEMVVISEIAINLALVNSLGIFGMEHLVIQFDIIKIAIDSLEQRALVYSAIKPDDEFHKNPEYIKSYRYCLTQIIQHHQILIKIFKHLESIVSFPIFSFVSLAAFIMASSAIGLQEVDARLSTKLICFSLLVTAIASLGIMCYESQQIYEKSAGLSRDLYFINWMDCHHSIKKIMITMCECTKRPLELSGGGLVVINLELFSSVMQACYSYVNLYNASKH